MSAMAGKFGLAAKIFLGTTLFAGGGGGVWYATTNGPLAKLASSEPASVVAEKESAPAESGAVSSDLDAVASVWGETESAAPESSKDSSPVARSAEVVAPVAEQPPTQPKAGDRYAIAETAETDLANAEIAPAQEQPADTAPSAEAPSETETAAVATPDEAETAASEPTPAETETATAEATPESADEPLARGQEPSDDAELSALVGDSGGSQLQPLVGEAQATAAAPSNAREAFQSAPAATPGDRYGAGRSPRTAAATSQAAKSDLVNPFNTAGTAQNSQPPAAASTSGALPSPPAELPGGLAELEEISNVEPATESTPSTATASGGGGSRDFRAMTSRGNPMRSEVGSPASSDAGPLAASSADGLASSEGAGRPGEKALEGPQRPSLEIQKFAPAEIQVGKPAKFVVRVRNVGTQAAEGVSIRDQVPEGTKIVSTTPEAQNAGGDIVWELGKLSPGEDRTVEMQLMPVSEGEIGSVATVSYSAQASVKTKCTMPQLAIRMTAPAKVLVGQQQRVKIELRNPGSGDATGVMLFENVPQTVKHPAGPALEFDIGTLRAGETRELELVLQAEKPGKTVNVLSARADGNLQVQQQVEFEVIAPALAVDVEGPERRYLERPATYEVSVENPGTAPAHDVQIVTKLPRGLRFVRANNMGEYDANSHAVYWSLAELPEGERGTVELVAMPIEAGPQTLQVESRAGQGLEDQTQQQIIVDGLAAIMFEVKDLVDPIEVGRETGYEIRVVNQGTKAATNVQVAVNLPPGMKLVSAEGETQHREQGGAVVFEPLAQLAAKADTLYRIQVQGVAPGDQRITVQVNTDDIAQPIHREESTRVFGDE